MHIGGLRAAGISGALHYCLPHYHIIWFWQQLYWMRLKCTALFFISFKRSGSRKTMQESESVGVDVLQVHACYPIHCSKLRLPCLWVCLFQLFILNLTDTRVKILITASIMLGDRTCRYSMIRNDKEIERIITEYITCWTYKFNHCCLCCFNFEDFKLRSLLIPHKQS